MATILVVGLNYRTAPVELREKLTLSGCALQIMLEDLRSQSATKPDGKQPSPVIDEAAILSTCNRLEVYAAAHHPDDGIAFIEQFLGKLQNIPVSELKPHLYHQTSEETIRHLMRVACGLDSMILGETQILGQVTQAGALLMMAKLNQRHDTRVLMVGAGEMAALALKRFEVSDLAFVNRTYNRAEALANDMGGTALTWYQLEAALIWADAVICATGAPHTVIYRHDVEAVLARREARPLVIVDIAVPRDVEDTGRELPGVHYYDIDDLQSVVDENLELRKAAVPQVEAIIQQELGRFAEWYHSRQVTEWLA